MRLLRMVRITAREPMVTKYRDRAGLIDEIMLQLPFNSLV